MYMRSEGHKSKSDPLEKDLSVEVSFPKELGTTFMSLGRAISVLLMIHHSSPETFRVLKHIYIFSHFIYLLKVNCTC